MHHLVRTLVAAIATLALGAGLTATLVTPSFAKTYKWNSKAKPLTLTEDGTKKAEGYGTWKIGTTENGTRSMAHGYLRDTKSNKKDVYFQLQTWVNAGYCWSGDYLSCNYKYYYWKSQVSDFDKETWDQNYWSDRFYASTSVSPTANYARARMRVAESNWGPDSFSGSKYTKGNKY